MFMSVQASMHFNPINPSLDNHLREREGENFNKLSFPIILVFP